ncbi:MAG: Rne/Rng family ribonuclease [Alphaproteobacteria bacterium]|nr:MAG: Rne/Rng family ribonuclease [Alphaproteobacteria bacterium]
MKLLIDHHAFESRAAVIDDNGVLQTLNIDTSAHKQTKGNIYLAKIVRVEPGIGAVFLDYGGKKNGFLPIGQLKKLLPDEQQLKRAVGENLLVQVIKEERQNKGCAFTIEISLAGHYSIILPFEGSVGGVSQKIKGSVERERLRKIVEKIGLPSYISVILRTSAEKRAADEIRKDIRYLNKLWRAISKKAQEKKQPGLVYEEHSIFERAVRDTASKDVKDILIEGKEIFEQVKKFARTVMPSIKNKIHEYNGDKPLFNMFHVNEQIEMLLSPLVPLKSGGTLVIQQTEALISIDVNSAGYKSKLQEDTSRDINVEACEEIARQILLRDISGIIVIDFIDMEREENNALVYKTLKAAFKHDSARTNILPVNAFGVIQMTRQRSKKTLSDYFTQKCPCCSGYGSARTVESMSSTILRAIKKKAAANSMSDVIVTVSKDVFDYMQNKLRRDICAIEEQHQVRVQLMSVWHINNADYNIRIENQQKPTMPHIKEEQVLSKRRKVAHG